MSLKALIMAGIASTLSKDVLKLNNGGVDFRSEKAIEQFNAPRNRKERRQDARKVKHTNKAAGVGRGRVGGWNGMGQRFLRKGF